MVKIGCDKSTIICDKIRVHVTFYEKIHLTLVKTEILLYDISIV